MQLSAKREEAELRTRWIGLVVALVLNGGCATSPPNDFATLEAELAAKRAASSREFSAGRDETIGAIQAVLDTMSDDFEYSVSDTDFLASRRIYVFGGLTIISGRDYWRFHLEDLGERRTRLTAAARHVNNSGPAARPIESPRFLSDIQLEAREGLTAAEATLFLDRVAYALAESTDWPRCRRLGDYRARNHAVLTCSGIGLNESTPPQPIR